MEEMARKLDAGESVPPGVYVANLPKPAEKPLAWTKEPPTVPGWYWWRAGSDDEAEVKEVCDVGYIACDHSAPTPGGYVQGLFKLGDVGGEWAGPISMAPPAC